MEDKKNMVGLLNRL